MTLGCFLGESVAAGLAATVDIAFSLRLAVFIGWA